MNTNTNDNKNFFEQTDYETVSDEELLSVSEKIMERNKSVYEELAK